MESLLQERGPILCLDIGSGTQDVVLARSGIEIENWPSFVLPSPAKAIAQRLEELAVLGKDIWFYGTNMGGGFGRALASFLANGHKVSSTLEASRAIHDCEENVQGMGITLSETCPVNFVPVWLGDYSAGFWSHFLHSCGLPQPSFVLAAAQDHGYQGKEGNRTARMAYWTRLLESSPNPVEWMGIDDPKMTRLARLREASGGVVADTAAAALLGALSEPSILQRSMRQGITIVNVGNGHIFAALVYRGMVHGLYEHHTGMRTRDELLDDLTEFRRCFLPTEKVYASGGHGTAYGPICEDAGGYTPTYILGPRREILEGCGQFIAPHGAMMLAGAIGLLWGYAKKVDF